MMHEEWSDLIGAPWRAEGWENVTLNNADGETMSACMSGNLAKAKARARLAAEAPAMLTALDLLLGWADMMGGWEAPEWEHARAIVKRARGDVTP